MRKKDLKTRMIVKFRLPKNLYLVVEDCDTMRYGHQDIVFFRSSSEGFMTGDDFNDDLTHKDKGHIWDIIAVYEDENYCVEDVIDETKLKLLWQRI